MIKSERLVLFYPLLFATTSLIFVALWGVAVIRALQIRNAINSGEATSVTAGDIQSAIVVYESSRSAEYVISINGQEYRATVDRNDKISDGWLIPIPKIWSKGDSYFFYAKNSEGIWVRVGLGLFGFIFSITLFIASLRIRRNEIINACR